MAIDNRHDTKVLQGLLTTTIDSIDGYHEAAKASANPDHVALFEARAADRQRSIDELDASLRALGGTPEEGGSILAKAHRVVLDIKHALTKDDQSVIDSVVNGEGMLLGKFDRALEDKAISSTTRETVRRAQVSVKHAHDEMVALKESLQGQKDADSDLRPN